MTLEQKLEKVYDILERDYDKQMLLYWIMETLPESALDEILANDAAEQALIG
jgi:hypothetical protein